MTRKLSQIMTLTVTQIKISDVSLSHMLTVNFQVDHFSAYIVCTAVRLVYILPIVSDVRLSASVTSDEAVYKTS